MVGEGGRTVLVTLAAVAAQSLLIACAGVVIITGACTRNDRSEAYGLRPRRVGSLMCLCVLYVCGSDDSTHALTSDDRAR